MHYLMSQMVFATTPPPPGSTATPVLALQILLRHAFNLKNMHDFQQCLCISNIKQTIEHILFPTHLLPNCQRTTIFPWLNQVAIYTCKHIRLNSKNETIVSNNRLQEGKRELTGSSLLGRWSLEPCRSHGSPWSCTMSSIFCGWQPTLPCWLAVSVVLAQLKCIFLYDCLHKARYFKCSN
jgi:hypothetical protein